jgi:hypothetical protein
MLPYLKGLHLTIDSWRGNRDEEGWRSSEDGGNLMEEIPDCAPSQVKAVPCLENDLQALEELTALEEPPWVRVRPSGMMDRKESENCFTHDLTSCLLYPCFTV